MKAFLRNVLAGLAVALVIVVLVEIALRAFLPFPLTTITTYQAFDDVTYFHVQIQLVMRYHRSMNSHHRGWNMTTRAFARFLAIMTHQKMSWCCRAILSSK